jgi:ParB-like chromosome segregation protein Spo0J
MSQQAIEQLTNDIRTNGLREPVTMLPDGRLLSGRGRWVACEIIGIKPSIVTYEDNDPCGFVLSQNRLDDLSDDRTWVADAAARKSQWTLHVAKLFALLPPADAKKLAVRFKVREILAQRAGAILLNAEPHIIKMVEAGDVTIRLAFEAIKDTPSEIQSQWITSKQVSDAGKAAFRAYPSNQPKTAIIANRQSPRPTKAASLPKLITKIEIPYGSCKFPTAAESGAPPPGSTLAEHDRFSAQFGRVPLHPKTVKEMLDCDSQTGHLTQ